MEWEVEIISTSLFLILRCNEMNDSKYKKKCELQDKIISRQLKQIENLNRQIENLKLELEEKNNIINSVSSLREELIQKNKDIDRYKKEYKKLIDELRKMKEILNQIVYKGRWRIIKFLMK